MFLSLNSLYVAPLLLTFQKKISSFLGTSNGTKNCCNQWKIEQVMPFESEVADLHKLNIIIQFVFLNLNSLYIAPLPSTFQINL
jgi:hypothetical protein